MNFEKNIDFIFEKNTELIQELDNDDINLDIQLSGEDIKIYLGKIENDL